MKNKKCSKCNIEKSILDFPKNSAHCKKCKREYNLMWRSKNIKKIKENRKQYHLEHPMSEEEKKKKKIYDEKYHSEHRIRRLKLMKQYAEDNKEALCVYRKKYRIKNINEIKKKRRINRFTDKEIKKKERILF